MQSGGSGGVGAGGGGPGADLQDDDDTPAWRLAAAALMYEGLAYIERMCSLGSTAERRSLLGTPLYTWGIHCNDTPITLFSYRFGVQATCMDRSRPVSQGRSAASRCKLRGRSSSKFTMKNSICLSVSFCFRRLKWMKAANTRHRTPVSISLLWSYLLAMEQKRR